jgi:hypothetical protein
MHGGADVKTGQVFFEAVAEVVLLYQELEKGREYHPIFPLP